MKKENKFLKRLVIFGTMIILMTGAVIPILTATEPQYTEYLTEFNELLVENEQLISETFIEVEVSRWTGDDEIVTTIEYWPMTVYIEFLEDMESVYIYQDVELKEDVLAMQTFQVMQQFDFITQDNNVLLEYMELVDDLLVEEIESSSREFSATRAFQVMQQYDFIPQDKTLDDLFEYLEEQYNENEELLEEYHDEYGIEGDGSLFVHIDGVVFGPFSCIKFPPLFYRIISNWGGTLHYYSYDDWEEETLSGIEFFGLEIFVYIGAWVPYLHNGWNIITRAFYGFAYAIIFDVY